MRLSDVLNRHITAEFKPIQPFIDIESDEEDEDVMLLKTGDFIELNIGKIMINYYCEECGDKRTFASCDKLHCLIVNDGLISIDSHLECPGCNMNIQVWYLVEIKELFSSDPKARVLKKTNKLSDRVTILNKNKYGIHTEFLEKATRASQEGFGAGSIVYLRKVFEQVTTQVAEASGIDTTFVTKKGDTKRKNFRDLLTEVDEKCAIIPPEFANNGYKLFGKLSDVIHGDYDEIIALEKFSAFYRLVTGVMDNVKNKAEFNEAMKVIGIETGGVRVE